MFLTKGAGIMWGVEMQGGILILLIIVAIFFLSKDRKGIPTMTARNMRNNNPCNLLILSNNEKWDGQLAVDTDYGTGLSYPVFGTYVQGLIAATKNLKTYRTKHSIKNVVEICARWTGTRNLSYVGIVAGSKFGIGIGVDETITDEKFRLDGWKLLRGITQGEGSNASAILDVEYQAAFNSAF